MTIKKFALASAAAMAFAGLLSATPVYAHTSQPATPEEILQTDALNAQALANARMGTTANQPLANTVAAPSGPANSMVNAPETTSPEATAPDNDASAPTTPPPPAVPAPTPQ